MATIQVRDIPPDDYETIRRRARSEGRSLQSYMRDVVVEFARRPTVREALASVATAREADPASPGATLESILEDLAVDRR